MTVEMRDTNLADLEVGFTDRAGVPITVTDAGNPALLSITD